MTIGVPASCAPYAKQLGSDRTTGAGRFVPSVSVIGRGDRRGGELREARRRHRDRIGGHPGHETVLADAVGREGHARRAGGAEEAAAVQRQGRIRPPWGRSSGCSTTRTAACSSPAGRSCSPWREFDLPAIVTEALTLAVPAPGPQRAATAVPLVVTTETRGRPFSPKVPKSVEKFTLVPSGTDGAVERHDRLDQRARPGLRIGVRREELDRYRARRCPPPLPGFGAVGASAAQACMPTTAATRSSAKAIRRMDPPYLANLAGAVAE